MNKIRENIKNAMEARTVKQVDLAELTGITKSTMSLFLSGKCGISIEKLEMIFEFLGLEITPKK